MIPLRPHHVLCSIGFVGKGYSDAFLANMAWVVDGRLRAPGGREERVRFASSADVICAPCPHRRGLGCEKQAQIDALDQRHGAALGLAEGQILTWGEAYDRALARIAPEDLDILCAGCAWLDQGMCKAALAAARKEKGAAPVLAQPPV